MAMTPAEKRALALRLAADKLEAEELQAKYAYSEEDVTPGSVWEAFKAGAAKGATFEYGDEAAAALSDISEAERQAANEEIDALINKNAANAAAGFIGGIVPTLIGGVANIGVKGATKLAGLGLGKEIGKLTAKQAAALAATEGAITGSGTGNTAGERIKGGAIGTVAGLAGAGGTAAANQLVKKVISKTPAGKMAAALEELALEQAAAEERKAADKLLKSKIVKKFKVTDDGPEPAKVVEAEPELVPVDIEEEVGDVFDPEAISRIRGSRVGGRPLADFDPDPDQILETFAPKGKKEIDPTAAAVERLTKELLNKPAEFADVPDALYASVKADLKPIFRAAEQRLGRRLTEDAKNTLMKQRIIKIMKESKKTNRSAGAMASDFEDFPEDELGQLQILSDQELASAKPVDTRVPTAAAMIDAGLDPDYKTRTDMLQAFIADQERRIPRMAAEAKRLPAGPERQTLVQEVEQMTAGLENLRDELRWRSAESAQQLSFDFPEAGGRNIAEQLARSETTSRSSLPGKRAPSSRSRMVRSKKPEEQKRLPSASTSTSAMVPSAVNLPAKVPVTKRVGKLARNITGDLELDEFRQERADLISDLDFYKKKVEFAKTPAERTAAEKELRSVKNKKKSFKKDYLDLPDLMKQANIAQVKKGLADRRAAAAVSDLEMDAADLDMQTATDYQTAAADNARRMFQLYPRLADEAAATPQYADLLRIINEWPTRQRAFAQSRALLRKFEETIGADEQPINFDIDDEY